MEDIDNTAINAQNEILNRIKTKIMNLEDMNLKRIDGVDKFSENKMVDKILKIVEGEIR